MTGVFYQTILQYMIILFSIRGNERGHFGLRSQVKYEKSCMCVVLVNFLTLHTSIFEKFLLDHILLIL